MSFLDNLFITQSIREIQDGFEVVVRCNPEHPVYKAHFPGNPITPGACLLQTAGVLMQEKMGRPLFLKASKNIKFLSIVVPKEGKEITYRFTIVAESETECKTQVVVTDENTIYTKMSLTYSYEPV